MSLRAVSHSVVGTFGVVQGLIAIAVAVTVYLRWKKEKERDDALAIKLDQARFFQAGVRRGPEPGPKQGRSRPEANSAPDPAKIESALPTWDNQTPPHVVLGVSDHASAEEIEAAYKRLLKRYHPDRFASWGKGYQKRAHFIVLLAQEARDQLLKKLQGRG